MYAVKSTRTLRISEAGELEGIDIHEHGAPAYHPEPGYTGIAPTGSIGSSRPVTASTTTSPPVTSPA
jgi:Amt family ammonium transporter